MFFFRANTRKGVYPGVWDLAQRIVARMCVPRFVALAPHSGWLCGRHTKSHQRYPSVLIVAEVVIGDCGDVLRWQDRRFSSDPQSTWWLRTRERSRIKNSVVRPVIPAPPACL